MGAVSAAVVFVCVSGHLVMMALLYVGAKIIESYDTAIGTQTSPSYHKQTHTAADDWRVA